MSALEADDFDEYKCVSENTIGRSEAVMNVYGKKLIDSWLIVFVIFILLCLLNNNETYSDLIEIAPEIEPQSTETHHISNTYLNEYGVEDDDEKSESNELDDVESDFPGTGTDHDEEDANKDQFRKNKSTLKGMLVDLVFMPV